jgi:hypothetical protein
MELLQDKDLYSLIKHKEKPCVSIYLPTHQAGSDTREDPIRLKNLLSKCKARLEPEYPRQKREELLKPGFELLRDGAAWQHMDNGLAIFTSPSFYQYLQLPLMPEERLHVGDFFFILPLIPSLIKTKTCYILVLSQKKIRLLKAGYENVSEVELPDFPTSIDEFLRYDVAEEHIQMHTTPVGKSAGSDALFHGQGNIADDARRKKNIERYMKKTAKAVEKQLQGQTAPLVLAGVEYEQSIYRQASSYRYLLEESIAGEFGQLDVKRLQQKARDIVEPHFHQDVEACLARYQNLVDTERTSTDIREILPASYEGRVDTLLVDINQHIRGKFEPDFRRVDVRDSEESQDEELLNLAAIYSLRSNARVCPISAEKSGMPVAAVFRY